MPSLSYALHDRLLGWLKGGPIGAPPTALRVALSTTPPNPDGTNVNEPPSASGYTRQPLILGEITRDAGVTSCKNTSPIVFIATANWPAVAHMSVHNQDGVMLFYGPLASPRTALAEDAIAFGTSTIQIRLK